MMTKTDERRPRRRAGTGGFTVLEVTVASAIVGLLLLSVMTLVRATTDDLRSGVATSDLEATCRRITSEIALELADSGFDGTDRVTSHPRAALTSGSSITFQRRVAFTGSSTDWGAAITYALVSSPGETPGDLRDDDRDGLVDEQRITRTQGGRTTVVADGVTALTFGRAPLADSITISVTVERADPSLRKPFAATVATRVALRNRL